MPTAASYANLASNLATLNWLGRYSKWAMAFALSTVNRIWVFIAF